MNKKEIAEQFTKQTLRQSPLVFILHRRYWMVFA